MVRGKGKERERVARSLGVTKNITIPQGAHVLSRLFPRTPFHRAGWWQTVTVGGVTESEEGEGGSAADEQF